jgi:diguanylate cyclase (GGDEF)-like protein
MPAVPGGVERTPATRQTLTLLLRRALGADSHKMEDSGKAVDLERFLSVLEGVRTVPFSGEFLPDGSFEAPYTGPGIHLLLGADLPAGVDGGQFWATRVLPADRAHYDEGMARQREGDSCQMEYRIEGLDGAVRWIRECTRTTRLAGRVRVDGIVIDVTDQRARADVVDELEDALRVTRGRLDSVLDAIDEYLYAWRYPADGPAVVDFESTSMAAFLGRTPGDDAPEDEWLGAVHPDDRRLVAEDVLARQAAGISGSVEYRVSDGQGRTRWLLDRWRCRPDPAGGVLAEGIVFDITSRRQAEDGMAAALASVQVAYDDLEEARLAAERASNTDLLTGVANRRSFQTALEQAVEAAAFEPFGLILLDVDHFKRTNDTYGHQAGDDVLVAVVERIQGSCPADATVGRWGGEEFTVLVPGVRSDDALRGVAESIRRTVRGERLETRRGALAVTISCGGVLSSGGRDTEELVHAADAAMYRAKQTGRDRTVLAGDVASTGEDEPELLLIAQSFAHTASIREGVAELHCAEVAELAGRIAMQLDLPDATVLRCRIAGWLHDVGKIAIPDRVLAKPGPLDDAEWNMMITHAAFGADLVARTPGIAESAGAVRHHHERWDGKGYPDHLAGADIPLEARVVAAADTWNAMTQDRVYRRALDFEAACSELLTIAGSQLDPRVAGALLTVVREERQVRQALAEDELAA